ncbi:pleckstrin homology domain-containing family A member 1-like isoform X2 [Acropora millepora]|uniref:pleckstrin homology domain-containing family A member 1-like isoform X2 n=1 Tax=Acropora millepora TaxID=45264 RepID=UPI0010FC6736|nr:pleckstrin homology domain-containing family A member 1-like isoform X2 [Acropora millepora]
MPFRDEEGRYCGTLHRKEVDNHWTRNYFILDEEKCLLRYFSPMEASIEDKSKSDDNQTQDHYFEIQTCKERFHLKAVTKVGKDEWITTLRKAAVNPSKRPEPREETTSLTSSENEKKSTEDSGKAERICYETKIIAGVVVRRPVLKRAESDNEGGKLSVDSLKRSGSAGNASTIKLLKEGYLTKKGAVVKSWKRRYFKLDFLKLAYYDKPTDSDPIRVINCSDIVTATKSFGSDREHLFEVVTDGRTFYMQGDTAEEMNSWIEAINGISHRGRSCSEPEHGKVHENGLDGKFQYLKTTTI